MVMHMVGYEYISKAGNSLRSRIKKAVKPLLKDGIGDTMDRGNLWVVPGFTIFAFAVLWTTKLSKIALEDSSCIGASVYDVPGSRLDEDAKKHCSTAPRYFVGINEPFSYEQSWREARQVKNPEWVLWFWAPVVFVMCILTRFIWTLLLENQGINFNNIVNAAQSVITDNEGVTEVDECQLRDRLPVIADNFRCAASSHAVAAFLTFELCLVSAPIFLLVVVLPLMIGSGYRSWGIDIARAWWEGREWKGEPLKPLMGSQTFDAPPVPLIPRITYCDYHYVSLGNDHVVTYRCYLDANWHERTALFTWAMLVFLAFVNFCNLFFWVMWAYRMKSRYQRQKYVLNNWLHLETIAPAAHGSAEYFAGQFRTGSLLLFYFIEAHTDRVVASAFCEALFRRWMHVRGKLARECIVDMPPDDECDDCEPHEPLPKANPDKIGWDVKPRMKPPTPNAPPETPSTSSTGTGSTGFSSANTDEPTDSEDLPSPSSEDGRTSKSPRMPKPRRPLLLGFPSKGAHYPTKMPDIHPDELDPLEPYGFRKSRTKTKLKPEPKPKAKTKKGKQRTDDDSDSAGRGSSQGRSNRGWKCAVM